MHRLILCLGFLFSLSMTVTARTYQLPQLINPGTIHIDQGQVFINDGPSILIYSLKDFTLQRKFGREGEGPREFKVNPNINKGGVYMGFDGHRLIISSIRRISFFTRNGDFINMINPRNHVGLVVKFGTGYIGDSVSQHKGAEFVTYNLYNPHFQKKQEIYRRFSWDATRELDLIAFTTFPLFYACGDKLFVQGDIYKDEILVFDSRLKLQDTITIPCRKLRLTESHQKMILDYFSKSAGYKGFIDSMKSRIVFNKHFPGFRHFMVAQEKIYVATYRVINGLREVFVLDLSGKLLKRTMLPILEEEIIHLKPYTIHHDTLYQLTEGADGEEWEVRISHIK